MIQYLFLFFFFILSFLSLSVCDVETRWEKWSKTQPAVYIVANNNSNNNIYIYLGGVVVGGSSKSLKANQQIVGPSIHFSLSLSPAGYVCWLIQRPGGLYIDPSTKQLCVYAGGGLVAGEGGL